MSFNWRSSLYLPQSSRYSGKVAPEAMSGQHKTSFPLLNRRIGDLHFKSHCRGGHIVVRMPCSDDQKPQMECPTILSSKNQHKLNPRIFTLRKVRCSEAAGIKALRATVYSRPNLSRAISWAESDLLELKEKAVHILDCRLKTASLDAKNSQHFGA